MSDPNTRTPPQIPSQVPSLENASEEEIIAAFDNAAGQFDQARRALQRVVFGQEEVIDLTLATLAAGGHGLLVGAPGLAKTLLVESIATVMGLSEKRIQFTPDLMPPDILGTELLEESETGQRAFRFVRGPIFTQLLMADEINRASPRTQSALLQAMQEKFVTVAGDRHDLPDPFHVLATQNPIEQEGTYPLPEAQLDRFLIQINVAYPDEAAERQLLKETTGTRSVSLEPVMDGTGLIAIQQLVRHMPVAERLLDVILAIVRGARPTDDAPADIQEAVAWGPGPRASQAFSLTARALALIEGRHSPSLDDIKRLAKPVLRHRMALTFAARAQGADVDTFIDDLVAKAVAQ
ncbi:MAG: MoxR family ATPase [Pseudomonadota bacterium]